MIPQANLREASRREEAGCLSPCLVLLFLDNAGEKKRIKRGIKSSSPIRWHVLPEGLLLAVIVHAKLITARFV